MEKLLNMLHGQQGVYLIIKRIPIYTCFNVLIPFEVLICVETRSSFLRLWISVLHSLMTSLTVGYYHSIRQSTIGEYRPLDIQFHAETLATILGVTLGEYAYHTIQIVCMCGFPLVNHNDVLIYPARPKCQQIAPINAQSCRAEVSPLYQFTKLLPRLPQKFTNSGIN